MIEFSQVKKSFGKVLVLDIDNLEIVSGTNNVLVGPNGAGKSTFLLLLAGLSRLTAGSILIGNNPAGSRQALRTISFAPDQPALFDDLTIGDQLDYVARLNGQSAPSETCRSLIDAFHATDLLDRFPNSMSKGERQKSSLLVATARPFEILLLDEPTTGLDSRSREVLITVLESVANDGKTIVSSTHDVELIARANRRIDIIRGQISVS